MNPSATSPKNSKLSSPQSKRYSDVRSPAPLLVNSSWSPRYRQQSNAGYSRRNTERSCQCSPKQSEAGSLDKNSIKCSPSLKKYFYLQSAIPPVANSAQSSSHCVSQTSSRCMSNSTKSSSNSVYRSSSPSMKNSTQSH